MRYLGLFQRSQQDSRNIRTSTHYKDTLAIKTANVYVIM